MKFRLYPGIVGLLLISALGSPRQVLAEPGKRALIITVGTYPAESGWPTLSAASDQVLIRQTLLQQRFPAATITTLADQQATSLAIRTAFDNLVATAQTGEVIVVHFSGHGQQIADDNHDEADGLDETIVPYNAPSRWTAGYTGERHIRDDELGKWVQALRQKVGSSGHVLLLLDSCHSGTAAKGTGVKRGGLPPLVPPGFSGQPLPEKGMSFIDLDASALAGARTAIGKFVLMTGSLSNQFSYETEDDAGHRIGSLTFAVCKAIGQLNRSASYQDLFAEVRNIMADKSPYQTPSLEGDFRFPVFNGAFRPQPGYFEMVNLSDLSQRIVRVAGGYLAGIAKGSRLAFYARGTIAANNPVGAGTVVEADNFTSLVRLDQLMKVDPSTDLQALVIERFFGNIHLNVKLEPMRDSNVQMALKQALRSKPAIQLVDEGEELTLRQTEKSLQVITATDGNLYGEYLLPGPSETQPIVDRLIAYAYAKAIRGQELSSPGLSVAMQLLPVRLSPDNQHIQDTLRPVFEGNYPAFAVGSQAWFTLTNVGSEPCYFTVLDVQPDGIVTVILPDESKGYPKESLRLGVGQAASFPVTGIAPPLGTEMYKVILTRQPIDLRPIVHVGSKGDLSQSVSHPIAAFFSRGAKGSLPGQMRTETTITGFTFRIVLADN